MEKLFRADHIWEGREEGDYNIKKIAGDLSDTDENLLPIFVHKFAIRLMNISIEHETRSNSLQQFFSPSLFCLFFFVQDYGIRKEDCNSVIKIRGKREKIGGWKI